jgi:hypothetical protein
VLITVNRLYSGGKLTKEEFLDTLKKIADYLDKSFACLKDEPEGTKEAATAALAKKALAQTKEIILFSDFL